MRSQTTLEEQLNTITHAIGSLLGIAGLVLLLVFNSNKTDWSLFSVIVYGISIIVLFIFTVLNSVKDYLQKKISARSIVYFYIFISS